jgi:hypothetical protein
MASEATLHILLQNKFDRVENLVQMNHAATLAVPSILATIWCIEGGLDNFRNVWILSIISIGLVLIWRYFAHFLDNGIAGTYIDIFKIECRLEVPPDLSIFNNLIDKLTTNQKVKQLDDDQKIKCLKCLYKKKKMGYRGHDKWDKAAYILIFVFVVVSTFTIFYPILIKTIHKLLPHFQVVVSLILKIAFFGIVFLFGLVITCVIWKIFKAITPIQRNPTEPEIQLYYDKITTPKKDISD